MLARAVVAKVQRVLKVQLDRLVAGRGDVAVRPVALIQDQALIQRIVVQVDPAFLHLNLAHAEVGIDAVYRRAVLEDADLEVVQIRRARLPDVDRIQISLDDQIHRHAGDAVRAVDDDLAPQLAFERDGQLQIQRTGRALIQRDLRGKHMVVNIRRDVDILEAVLADSFHIDGLPDAGNRRIPAAHQAFGPVLLAARLGTVRIVLHAHAQIVFAILELSGDIQRKRRIAALMLADHLTVDIDAGLEIHRAKAQQNALALHFSRDFERTAVPDHRMNRIRRAKAAGLGLIGKGNGDLQRQLRTRIHPAGADAFILIVKSELPDAVEIQKRLADKIRPRVLRPRDHVDLFTAHRASS